MQQIVTVRAFAVRRSVLQVEFVNPIHDFNAQLIGSLAVTKAALLAFLFQQDVAALGQAHHAVHGGEAVAADQAFLHQKTVFKEAAFLHQEAHARIHVARHHVHHIGQLVVAEVLEILGALGDIGQQQTGKRVAAAALVKAVVAAGNAVIALVKLGAEHLVIGKAGLGTAQRALHSLQQEVVFRLVAHAHGDVGHGVFKLGLHLQDQRAHTGFPGADVGMREGVKDGAVHIDEEQAQRAHDGFVIKTGGEGLQQGIQIAQIHGIIGDAGYVVIENQQVVERFKQILGRIQL